MNEYIKLTPYIPNDEGYIQQEKPEIFVRKDTISMLCDDLPRNATRIELTNGNIHYVLETVKEIMNDIYLDNQCYALKKHLELSGVEGIRQALKENEEREKNDGR